MMTKKRSAEKVLSSCSTKEKQRVLETAFLISRRKSPAATFQMINFSAADNLSHKLNADPDERGYGLDCEQPEIAVPVRMI
jgi:hypothetical protein